MMGVSDRAWAKMKANPAAPRASVLSIVDWENAWSRRQAVPVHAVGRRDQRPRRRARPLSQRRTGGRLGAPRADRQGHACRASRPWACRSGPRATQIASPTTTAVRTPDGIDETALRQRGARPLRRRVLVGPRRDARQADAHRPHGADRAADLCGRGADGAWRRLERDWARSWPSARASTPRSPSSTPTPE